MTEATVLRWIWQDIMDAADYLDTPEEVHLARQLAVDLGLDRSHAAELEAYAAGLAAKPARSLRTAVVGAITADVLKTLACYGEKS